MHRKTLKFSFSNKNGQKLAGIIDLPEHDPVHYAVFAPCFSCVKESHAAHKVARALASRGVATLRFDLTGLGESQGNFADTNFSSRILDIIAACHALGANYQPPAILIGHSISGTAALSAVHHLPSIRVLATLGSPCDPAYIISKFRRNNQIREKDGMLELMVAGHPVMVAKGFIDDMLAQHVIEETAEYHGKLFVFHAPHDEIVSFENARTIYDRATCDKELVTLSEQATHLLEQGAQDAAYMADVMTGWLDIHPQS